GGVSSLITGLPVRGSLVVVPVILGVVIPIIAFISVVRLDVSPQWGVIAAAFTALIPTTVLFSHNPVAQSISVPIALTFVLTILVDPFLYSRRTTILTGFLYFVLLFTHKLAPLIIVISFIFSAQLVYVVQTKWSKDEVEPGVIRGLQLGAIFACVYYLQWTLTNIGQVTSYTIIGIFTGPISDSIPPISPTHAQPVFNEVYQLILLNVGYFIPLLMLAGAGWLLVIILNDIQLGTALLLSVVGVSVGVTIASFFG
ncbi:hypothetical protein, partial [Halorubrum sp. Atlit-26R]|uniref:hypothetical protein n=1 Tax=Halorubrum sp. Atlit-26R TaxID=2282128 RepID=UPI001314E594